MHAQQVGGDVVSKGEFARRCNVTAGRVSQWISQGKIHGKALVGEGRAARINEAVAKQQLARRLDVGQRMGNGLGTNLKPLESSPIATPVTDTVADLIQSEKLEQLRRANREGARQEAIAAGLLTDAVSVRQVVGREVARLVSSFDGGLANFASAIAAQFKLPQRDVLHLLRAEFRKWRATEAEAAQSSAEIQPETVAYEVADAEP